MCPVILLYFIIANRVLLFSQKITKSIQLLGRLSNQNAVIRDGATYTASAATPTVHSLGPCVEGYSDSDRSHSRPVVVFSGHPVLPSELALAEGAISLPAGQDAAVSQMVSLYLALRA